MNENDKILIHAYLDGETSNEDSKYVESLLESNNEANEYANNIKKANNEINSFFNTSDLKKLDIDITEFIEKVKGKKRENIFEKLVSFFKSRYVVGSFIATSIIYFVFIPTYINQDSDMLFTDNLSEFNIEIQTLDFLKYRGDSDMILENTLIKDSIDFMIENKLINIVMLYGNDSYFIKIQDIDLNTSDKYCLNGYYKYKGDNTFFKFCKTIDETTITIN